MGLVHEAGDGMNLGGDFAFAEVLAQIDFDHAGEGGHGSVVNGVGKGRFDVTADGVEHDERKADKGGDDGCGEPEGLHKSQRNEQAGKKLTKPWEVVVPAVGVGCS